MCSGQNVVANVCSGNYVASVCSGHYVASVCSGHYVVAAVNASHGVVGLGRLARELLANSSRSGALRLPSVFSYLPHLLQDPLSTSPAFALSRGRMDGRNHNQGSKVYCTVIIHTPRYNFLIQLNTE